MIKEAQNILKDIFGYDDFRPLQKEVIENVLKKKRYALYHAYWKWEIALLSNSSPPL